MCHNYVANQPTSNWIMKDVMGQLELITESLSAFVKVKEIINVVITTRGYCFGLKLKPCKCSSISMAQDSAVYDSVLKRNYHVKS
jgi:hypothetical protein